MKNKIIKISIIAVVSVALLTAGIILLTQFTGLNGVKKNIQNSMQSVKTVTSTVTVTDSNVQVYGYDKKVELDSDNAVVIEAESTLNAFFELVRQPEKQSNQKIDRSKLFNLDLKGEYMKSAKYENGVYTAQILAEDATELFGNAIKPNEKADLTLVMENKRLISLTLSYIDNGRAVKLFINYAY